MSDYLNEMCDEHGVVYNCPACVAEPYETEILKLKAQIAQLQAALVEAEKRIAELKKALNDLLNDCINFNGAELSNWPLEQASKALNGLKES